jgi:hypothetical protein
MKTNLDSKIVKMGPKYTSQGQERHSSKPAYKPHPMVQMEFDFSTLESAAKHPISSIRKTPRK